MTNPTPEITATFTSLNLPEELLSQLIAQEFTIPTPIQQKTIPLALAGHDILGTAQTGTGKTLAFALPMVAHLLKNRDSQLIVLVPTRELAQQVLKTFQLLTTKLRFLNTVLLIGGVPSYQQKKDLRRDARIIVGTPGRVIDHLTQGSLKADKFGYVVLDEMDRMLDMGFELQLKEIFEHLPKERQTLMYSATLPENIKEQANRYLKSPQLISIGKQSQPAARIEQQAMFVAGPQKLAKLIEILETHQTDDEQATIVFVKTKTDASDLAFELRERNFQASAMHGDLSQSQRQRVLQQFRFKKLNILVATDIAARGIDVSHVGLVVNYALPQATEDYIHRIGRTARGGRAGLAISLISFSDKRKWYEILQLTDPEQAQGFYAEHLRNSSAPSARRGGKPKSAAGGGRGGFGQRSFSSEGGRGGQERRSFGEGRSFESRSDDRRSSFGPKKSFDTPYESRAPKRFFKDKDQAAGGERSFNREDRPAFNREDRPSFNRGERPAFNREDRPSFNRGERPAFNRDERSSNRGERSFGGGEGRFAKKSSDKPAWGQRDDRRNDGSFQGGRRSEGGAPRSSEPRRWNVSDGKIAENS